MIYKLVIGWSVKIKVIFLMYSLEISFSLRYERVSIDFLSLVYDVPCSLESVDLNACELLINLINRG